MKTLGASLLQSWKVHDLAMAGFFVFCHVIGFTCAVPDVSLASGNSVLSEEAMACPMDERIMCPPSATSSPERQIKHGMTLDVDHAPVAIGLTVGHTILTVPTQWSWSRVLSIVPISIDSSSVLRI